MIVWRFSLRSFAARLVRPCAQMRLRHFALVLVYVCFGFLWFGGFIPVPISQWRVDGASAEWENRVGHKIAHPRLAMRPCGILIAGCFNEDQTVSVTLLGLLPPGPHVVLEHEIGHSLGLKHSDTSQLMNRNACFWDCQISSEDVSKLQSANAGKSQPTNERPEERQQKERQKK